MCDGVVSQVKVASLWCGSGTIPCCDADSVQRWEVSIDASSRETDLRSGDNTHTTTITATYTDMKPAHVSQAIFSNVLALDKMKMANMHTSVK